MGQLEDTMLFVRRVATIGLVTLALSGLISSSDAAPGTQQGVARLPVIHQGQTPLAFVENRGQVDPRVEFYLKTPGQVVWVTRDGVVFDLVRQGSQPDRDVPRPGKRRPLSGDQTPPPTKERLVFAQDLVGADLARRIEAGPAQPGVYNYFIGNDPAKWRTGVRAYADVVYRDVWAGIDLKLYGNGRALEQEFVVRPGVDPARVQVAYRGIEGLAIAAGGSLVIKTAFGELHESVPRIYQEIAGKRVEVTGRYKLLSPTSYAFEVGAYDRMYALVIDPTLTYSTYLGGSGTEEARGIAVDSSGSAYVAGTTTSIDFPTTTGVPSNAPGLDVFVTKLTPDGSNLVFSTYLGGSGDDTASSGFSGSSLGGNVIAVNAGGVVAVVGQTNSTDFPLSVAFQGLFGGGPHDAFVTQLDSVTGALTRSSYLGGSGDDLASSVAVDSAGAVYVTGGTTSTNFPTGGTFVFQSVINCSIPSTCVPTPGAGDAFVTKIDPGWTIGYSTYLGGSSGDSASAIAVDSAGNAYVTGGTQSFDFAPGAGGIAGGADAFAARFDSTGHLTWATFFGGPGDDNSSAIAVDGSGMVYITGVTFVPFGTPILPAVGLLDAFVAKLDPNTHTIGYFTFLGGTGSNIGQSIAVDFLGHAYVAGVTDSTDFPTQGTALPSGTPGGAWDVFVANFDLVGNLKYSAVIGAEATDQLNGAAVDSSGAVYLTGYTSSTDFPTAGSPPYQATPLPGTTGGNLSEEDTFVAKISPAATMTMSPLTNPSTAGQLVTFNLTVSIGASPAPDGRVRVYDDFSFIRDLVLSPTDNGHLTFVYAPPSAGEHRMTAYYEPAPTSPVDLYSVASVTQFVVGGGTTSTALSAPLVVSPLVGSSGPQPIGDILISETIGGSILTSGRVTLMLPPGMTFAALPTVSAPVAHGLQIVRSGVDAPRIEGIGDQFSFKLQTSSSGGPAVLLVSGISVIVQSGFVPGTHFTSVDGSGVSQNAVNNVMVATESTTPSVSSVSNATVGRGADDFTIVLTGINFGPGATVSFSRGGVPATDITIVSITVNGASQLTIKVDVAGNAPLGPLDVIVSNPGGGSVTLSNGLSITAAPTITSVLPTPVLRTGLRQSLRLAGSNFLPPTQSPPNIGATISGTGITIEGVGFNNSQEIVLDVVVAVDAALTARTVTVTNPDGGAGTSGAIVTLADPTTIVIVGLGPRNQPTPPPTLPTITAISPPSARRGTPIQITGTGFSTTAAEDTVTFTGTAGSKVTVTASSATATSVVVTVPAGAVDGPVVVGVKGLLTNALNFGVTDPSLSSVVPETPAVLGGTTILDISGSKFTAGSTVEISGTGVSVGSISLVSSSLLTVPITIIATAAAGPRDVTVRNVDGSSASRTQAFQISDPNQVAFAISVLNTANQDITATFQPSVDATVTVGADGKCTAKTVTPSFVRVRATYLGTGTPPAQARFDLTGFTSYLGTAINDDCEIDPVTGQRTLVASRDVALSAVGAAPPPSVYDPASLTATASDQGGGVYVVQLWTYDWGASALVRVSRTDAVPGSGTMTIPLDADGDSLPDVFEDATTLNNVNAAGVAVVELNATAGGARVLDRLSATAGGSVKSAADGYTNFEKYRGVYLKGPSAGQTGALQYHVRLGAGQRHLFLRGHGFAGDFRLAAGQCGVEPPVANRSSLNFNQWTPVTDTSGAACPRFEVGTAFAGESIQVHDVTPAFSATTAFPRVSFQTGVDATADMAELAYDAYNCNGGEPCDHTSKTGPRNWKFWTYGVSAVGSATQYGIGARVVKKVVDSLFGDKPYEHRTNDATRVVTDGAGNAMLAPLTIVADNSSKGPDDGLVQSEPVDGTGKLLGDTYIPTSYAKDFTVFDTNKDSCTELPLVTDPTALTRCPDLNAASASSPQATRQQAVRLMITHEVGHMIGASIYHNTNPQSVEYQYTNNWDRDNLFGPETAPELRLHNRGQQ